MKQDKKEWLIVGAIIVILVVLLRGGVPFIGGQLGFLGALVTVCDNNEPASLTEHATFVAMKNGTIIGTVTYGKSLTGEDGVVRPFNQTTQTVSLAASTYYANGFTGIQVYEYKALIQAQAKNLSITNYNTKSAMVADGVYYWANPTNNLLFSGNEYGFVAYTNSFVSCNQVEQKTAVQLKCEAAGAGYDPYGDDCVCPGEKVWSDTEKCHLPPVQTSTVIPSQQSSTSSSSTQSITPTGASQENKTLYFLAALILLAVIIYYFAFEKGPNKGIIGKGFKLRR